MKKNIMLLLAAFLVLMFAGCGSSGEKTPTAEFTGEWHLVQWSGAAPTEFDAYVVFNADRTFVIYQRIEKVDYQTFTGRWAYDGKLLSGLYDDDKPWGSDYEVALDDAAETLTLTSLTSVPEVGVYRREAVPESIKNAVVSVAASRSEIERLL